MGQEYHSRRSPTPAAGKQGFRFLQLGFGQNKALTNDTLETRLTWSVSRGRPMADKGPHQPDTDKRPALTPVHLASVRVHISLQLTPSTLHQTSSQPTLEFWRGRVGGSKIKTGDSACHVAKHWRKDIIKKNSQWGRNSGRRPPFGAQDPLTCLGGNLSQCTCPCLGWVGARLT